jgi:putative transposase
MQVYQERFKSFPIAADEHFLNVSRYVERNALRAGMVQAGRSVRWCSLWQRQQKEKLHIEKERAEVGDATAKV